MGFVCTFSDQLLDERHYQVYVEFPATLMGKFMKASVRQAVVVLIASGFLLAIGCLIFFAPAKPAYAGRAIDEWFAQLENPYSTNAEAIEARTAFTKMGSKAVPYIIRELHSRDSRVKTILLESVSALPMIHIEQKWAAHRHWQAIFALEAIPPSEALPALPALVGVIEDGELYPKGPVLLAKIGQGDAVPWVTRLLTNVDSSVRLSGARALICLGTNAWSQRTTIMGRLKAQDPNLYSLLFDGQNVTGGMFGTNAFGLLEH